MGGLLSRGEKRPVCPRCHKKFGKTTGGGGAIRSNDCSCAYELPKDVVKTGEKLNGCQPGQQQSYCSVTFSPYVFRRWSSQYFDADGDLSHEFYEEIPSRKHRGPLLVRIEHGLIPQGWVDYEFPRLRSDLPYVMVELGSKSNFAT